MALNIQSLKEVRRLLSSIRRKWYGIGIELDIKTEELDTIKDTHSKSDPNESLIEMLKIWLKRIDPKPTWKALGDALKAEHEEELAKEALKRSVKPAAKKSGATGTTKATSAPKKPSGAGGASKPHPKATSVTKKPSSAGSTSKPHPKSAEVKKGTTTKKDIMKKEISTKTHVKQPASGKAGKGCGNKK